MDILGGGFHTGTSQAPVPMEALADTVSSAELHSVFPLSAGSTSLWLSLWPLFLMAVWLF